MDNGFRPPICASLEGMDDIPPMQGPQDLPPIRTEADLERHWRMIKGPWGFAGPQLWLHVLDGDDRSTGVLTKIDELPATPARDAAERLIEICQGPFGDLLEQRPHGYGGSLAVLFARPGRSPMAEPDLRWGREVTRAARRARVGFRTMYFANDHEVRPFTADDLGLPRPAA